MDYEKKYKEALEIAQKLYQDCPNGKNDRLYHTTDLEKMFPELRESEDERIRKELIEFVKSRGGFKQEYIAWLEKQDKEDSSIQQAYEWGYTEGKRIERKHWVEKQKFSEDYNSIDPQFGKPIEQNHAWLEKQGEQEVNEPDWCHHKVDLSDCSEEYRKAYYDGWNNCNQQHSQCKSEWNDVVKCLINGMKFYYEGNEEATWGTEKFSMKVKDILSWLEKQCGEKPADKVELKFKVGDWVVCGKLVTQITSIEDDGYTNSGQGFISFETAKKFHLWTIQDAKDGDVLATKDNCICIFDGTVEEGKYPFAYCGISMYGFRTYDGKLPFTHDDVYPATKEQRDLLFQKMKEDGYEWDAEKKELKEIKDEEYNGEDYGIDSLWHAKNILEETLGKVDGYQTDDGILEHKCAIAAVNKLYKQKPAEWSEEDECYMGECIGAIATKDGWSFEEKRKTKHWLKSIKERYTWKPSDEQILALDSTLQYSQVSHNSYENLNSLYNDLKKLTE